MKKETIHPLPNETWNLSDLYAHTDDWYLAKNSLVAQFPTITSFQNQLGQSAAVLLECLALHMYFSKELARLSCYAHMHHDEDTRTSQGLALTQEIAQVMTLYQEKSCFIEPEILRIEETTLARFFTEAQGLKPYEMYLHCIKRKKLHTLSDKEETIIAQTGRLADSAYSGYTVLSNADLPYPEITLRDHSRVRLDPQGYARTRCLDCREDRIKVYTHFWNTLAQFRRTFGVLLYSTIQQDIFYAFTRRYPSCLAWALDEHAIPTSVYTTLITHINEHLPLFHRYLQIKQKLLGLDKLYYYDLFAPLKGKPDISYTFPQAKDMVMDSLAVLGPAYQKGIHRALNERWIDVFPRPGKHSGAYMNGNAYEVHPYILLNFQGRLNDISTLTHELGHAMHSYYSNTAQPYPTAHYATFIAEIASIVNEHLLLYHLLDNTSDADQRLALYMHFLDEMRSTLFRQTQFAEFELAIHTQAEQGNALTESHFSHLYGTLLKKYHGHAQGICTIDELYCVEWAYIPHFYYHFYVYQYATSCIIATVLAERLFHKDKATCAAYTALLQAGGSDYPLALLKKIGIDITSPEPFHLCMTHMKKIMDEIS